MVGESGERRESERGRKWGKKERKAKEKMKMKYDKYITSDKREISPVEWWAVDTSLVYRVKIKHFFQGGRIFMLLLENFEV